MTAAPETARRPKPRERILTTAAELFLREGINAVTLDRLSVEAKVSKRSLYQHFRSKEQIVAEMLEYIGPHIVAITLPPEDDDRSPAERILQVFDNFCDQAASPGFTGCPFMNITTELRDPSHPGFRLAREYKDQMTDYFQIQAAAAGARDPETLAIQLTMLFDGANAYRTRNGHESRPPVRPAAQALLEASL